MSEPDLRTRIKEMLVKNLMLQTPADQIGDDLPLFGPNGLGLDSIDALELAVSMEKTFGVGVPNSEVAGKALRTVNTIHDYVLEKLGKTDQTDQKIDKHSTVRTGRQEAPVTNHILDDQTNPDFILHAERRRSY